MKSGRSSILRHAVAAAICLLLSAVALQAHAQPRARAKRDISGIWTSFPFSLSFDPATPFGQPQKVSLTPEYEARYRAQQLARARAAAAGKPLADGLTLCLPVGMPLAMAAGFPMEIVVTSKVIYVLPEGLDPPVRIFMDGRKIPALDDLEPTYEGFSVGHWAGDTLVVETAGVKTSTDISGVPHSNAMRITQRIRVVDDDTLANEITITDPKAFRAPWVIKKKYKDYLVPFAGATETGKHAPADIAEYVCNENNRNLPDANGIVGARVDGN